MTDRSEKPSQDTTLHRAIRRVAAEFTGTAEGQVPEGIVTFAVRGFSETDPHGPRRTALERIGAEVGAGVGEVLDRDLEEGALAAGLADLAEQYRIKAMEAGSRDARDAYEALADALDASVFYNRDRRAASYRHRSQPVKA